MKSKHSKKVSNNLHHMIFSFYFFPQVSEDLNSQFRISTARHDTFNIKILNAGAWAQCSERVSVSLPLELEDYIPEVEEFYKKTHSGRKLQWYHHMSNGTITFCNNVGRFDLDVTTFQMAVLFAWNQRPLEKVSYENLRLASELPGSFYQYEKDTNVLDYIFLVFLFRSRATKDSVVFGCISKIKTTTFANGSGWPSTKRFLRKYTVLD